MKKESLKQKILNGFFAIGKVFGYILAILGNIGQGIMTGAKEETKNLNESKKDKQKKKENGYKVTFMPSGWNK